MRKASKVVKITSAISVIMLSIIAVAISLSDVGSQAVVKKETGKAVAKPSASSRTNDPSKFAPVPIEEIYREVPSINDAKAEINFSPRVPKSPRGRSLARVQVKRFPKEHRGIRLDYGDIIVLAEPSEGASDYGTAAKEMPDKVKLTSVNAMPAFEIEKGEQEVEGSPGLKSSNPAVFGWHEDGVRYTIFSYSADLATLKAFVESMF